MHAAPMYIAETAPSQIRGRLISLKEFFIVLGMVVSAWTTKKYIDYTWFMANSREVEVTLKITFDILFTMHRQDMELGVS